MSKKKQEEEEHYLSTFLGSLVLTIIAHYLIFSKIEMHPTLHVLIALILFWAIMAIVGIIREKQ
jgi:hypothetical protein